MKNGLVMKGLVLGIIVLFVGASVIPSTGITLHSEGGKKNGKNILYNMCL